MERDSKHGITRRGFLGLLSSVSATSLTSVQANEQTVTDFTKSVKFDDVQVTHKGADLFEYAGGNKDFELKTAFTTAVVVFKCRSDTSPWYYWLHPTGVIPDEVNQVGKRYVAYCFSESIISVIKPYLNNFTKLETK